MPKIPTQISEVGAPFVQGPQIRTGIFGEPGAIAAAGGEKLTSEGNTVLHGFLRMEAERTRQQEVSDAYDFLLQGSQRRAQMVQGLHEGVYDENGNMQTPAANSKDYMQRSSDGMDAIGQDIASKITNPGVKDVFLRGWKRESISQASQAGHFQWQLLQNEQTAEVTQRYHDALRIIGQSTPEEAEVQAGLYRTYLTSKQGVIAGGPARAEVVRQMFDKEVNRHFANLDIQSGNFSAEELEKKYNDKLDPGVLDALVEKNATRINKAQKAWDQSVKNWNESVQRVTATMISKGTLTEDFLDFYKDAFSGEQLQAYYKVLRDQSLNVNTLSKNADAAKDATLRVGQRTDLSINPEAERDNLARLYRKEIIGADLFIPYTSLWSTEIERRRNDSKTSSNKDEMDQRRFDEHSYRAAMDQANILFKPSDMFKDYDAVLSTNKNLLINELNRRSRWMGGAEDSQELMRELLPRYLGPTETRAQEYMSSLRNQIHFNSVEELTTARPAIGNEEYRRQLQFMKSLRDMETASQKYELLKNRRIQVPVGGQK
jgi:hypothetical protein